jgi:uncharacterized protein
MKVLQFHCRLVAGVALSFVFAINSAAALPATWRTLRYDGVVEQSKEFNCGAAAVATLLKYFYNIEASEDEVMNLALASMESRGVRLFDGQGLTAYDLKAALGTKGVASRGFLVKPAALHDYFARGGLPVIIHLTKPQKHFEVAVGMIEDHIVIADPSWGRSVFPLTELAEQRGYTGVVLVPIPSSETVSQVAARQKNVLNWAEHQLARLSQLRESLP